MKAIATVAALALAGCGGSQGKPARPTAATRPTGFSVGVGLASARISATLVASDHSPVAGKGWPYSVRVTDRTGRPLAGTVKVQFDVGGHVLGTDSPPVHPLKDGRWHEEFRFPDPTIGLQLTFQVVVHTDVGSVTLNWPVSIRP